jgi:hypothetical protein
MRSVSDKICIENQNKHLLNNWHPPPPPVPENCAVYEIMLKNAVESKRGNRWQYNMVQAHCMLDKQYYTRAHMHIPPHLHVYRLSCITHTHRCLYYQLIAQSDICCIRFYVFRPWILAILSELRAFLTYTAYLATDIYVSGRQYTTVLVRS